MDTPDPHPKAALLHDLESIRQLLGDDGLQPPLLTEMVDDTPQIPVLQEVIKPTPAVSPAVEEPTPAPVQNQIPLAIPATATTVEKAPDALLLHLDKELRTAAQQIMQEVINDFTPHIETEVKRRLDAHLERLLTQL